MPLQGSLLDYRPPSLEDQYDPRVVRAMKQRGVWPPGTRYHPGSKGAMHEDEIINSINEQLSREDITSENRAQRAQTAAEAAAARRDYNNALIADRQARTGEMGQRADTERMAALQFVASDPNSPPETKKAAIAQIASIVGVGGGAAAPPVGTVGGTAGAAAGAPAPTGARGAYTPADVGKPAGYAPPTGTFTPTPSPVAEGTASQLADNTARIYGVSGPLTRNIPQAADIPQIYGGQSRIPPGAGAGYYRDKTFLGPAYSEGGEKLPIPKGATGMVGTAGMGLQYDAAGNIVTPLSPRMAQQVTGGTPAVRAGGNIPTNEEMTPTPYIPTRDLFTAGAPAGVPAPAPTPTPAPTAEQPWTAEQGLMHQLLAKLFQRGAPPWVSEEDLKKRKFAQQEEQ